ncbi:DUF6020 family protein [Streptacidiphilus sp. EB129]|uniref:DUF6020 family protein n=1 Tax=Streptacidiphilus sp. EB129 TaxID=3156262 RepID=UPI0035150FF2
MARPAVLAASPESPGLSVARLRAVPPERRVPLTVFVTVLLLLLVQWAAFFPGLLSPDSYTYVWEVTTGHWISDHSIAYDALLWLSLKGTGGIWALTLAQAVAAAAVTAYTAGGLHRLGARGRWIWASAVLLAVLPSTASFTMFVWKDVAFSLSALLAFGACVHLLARFLEARRTGQRPRPARLDLGMLGLGFAGLALFRNNGLPVVLVAAVALLVFLPGMRKAVLLVTAAAVALYALLGFGVYPAAGVRSPQGDSVYALNFVEIGVVYKVDPSSFTAADLQLMQKVAPLSHWRQDSDCSYADSLMWAPFNPAAANRYSSQLLGLWVRVVERTPLQVVRAHLCMTTVAWLPIATTDRTLTYVTMPTPSGGLPGSWSYHSNAAGITGTLHGNPYLPALRSAPLSATLHRELNRVYVDSTLPYPSRVIWRGVDWCYLTYGILLFLAWRRRNRALCALLGVSLGLQLTVLAANPSQLARYMIAPVFIGLMCLPLLAPRRRNGPPWSTTPDQGTADQGTAE